MVINWKSIERKALIRFLAIYMFTSFLLLAFVAFLYYLDARKDSLIDVRSEMLKALYAIRENPEIKIDKFSVVVADIGDYVAPSFREYKDRFELVACANPHHQDKVYVITAPLSIANNTLNEITNKILLAYSLLFIPFFAFGYLLARLSLIPLKNSYSALVSFNEDIIHDLKTPITTISINGELLENQTSKPLKRITNATKTLEALYLNLESYLRTGKHLKIEVFDLNEVVRQRVEAMRAVFSHAIFSVEVPETFIESDKINFTRIFDNIVTNAIKHGNKEPIIKIFFEQNTLHIEDNGSGINNAQKIFERHYCETPYVKGFGLGLNIVKRLSEQLDIEICVSSSSKGTTFSLDLTHIILTKRS